VPAAKPAKKKPAESKKKSKKPRPKKKSPLKKAAQAWSKKKAPAAVRVSAAAPKVAVGELPAEDLAA
jgi:hypothetical protein